MLQERIVVDLVTPPTGNKKMVRVRTTDGRDLDHFPDAPFTLIKGDEYEVSLEPREYKGKMYYTIREALPVSRVGQGSQNPQRSLDGPGEYQVTDKEQMIFVTGVVGRAMGSGKFNEAHIAPLTLAAAQAWNDLMQVITYGYGLDANAGYGHGDQQEEPPGYPEER